MAEIEIEKKKPIWPWIVGALIIAALLYFFLANDDNDSNDDDALMNDTRTEEAITTTQSDVDTTANINLTNVPEIETYTDYIADSKMGVDHEYTQGAIDKLIAATRAVANKLDVNLDADLSDAKQHADEITKDPTKLNHADKIKKSAESITRALKTIQTEKAPGLESEYKQVEATVELIDPKTKTLDQKDEVKAFFNSAGNFLTLIKNQNGQ